MRFTEIETKYSADDIKLQDFKALALKLGAKSERVTGSFDHYYSKDETTFVRFRAGDRPELTMKVKLAETNNFKRIECNLPLDSKQPANEQKEIVDKFCQMLGFDPRFTIYKTCFIYYWDKHNLVYYIVYDKNLKETGRFVEIEMSEGAEWESETQAWDALVKLEKEMESLGIKAQRRVRLSLYEMYK